MCKKNYIGSWRIIEMGQWDQGFIDEEMEGYISFSKGGKGEFHVGYVFAWTDYCYLKRDGKDAVEFSFKGVDAMYPVCGRGSAIIKNKRLYGHLFFHGGDAASFQAERK